MTVTATIPYDPLWTPLEWAKVYCPSYISNDLHQTGYYTYDRDKIDYFFGNDKDAMWFLLRWS